MYIVKVPLERGKYKPGDILPEDYQVDVSWIKAGFVEEKAAAKPIKIKLNDKDVTK